MGRRGTRVAVVQLDGHPAAVLPSASAPLEDPLFGGEGDTLPTPGEVDESLAAPIRALRGRVRDAYCAHLLRKVTAILEACRGWGVQLVVFPEYTIPWQILDGVAAATGELVVVAGTHAVTREARQSGVYARLSGAAPPALVAVAPVLHRGKLLALTEKLHAARPEQGGLVESARWAPVALPPDLGLPSPLGVVICLDFLVAPGAEPDGLTRDKLQESRLLAVPSWTSTGSLREFDAVAWVSAARGRTPVLYANIAAHGGSTIHVDQHRSEAGRFPHTLGRLVAGDEGMVVADIDFSDQRRGTQTMYLDAPIVRPVAQASLVYRAQTAGDAYAVWLASQAPALAGGEDGLDAVLVAIEADASVLRAAGGLPGAAARGLRLRSLLQYPEGIHQLEDAACRLREVVLPADVLPHAVVRAALALGAQQAVDDLLLDRARDPHQRVLVPVRDRLRAGAEPARALDDAAWTVDGRAAVAALVAVVRGAAPLVPVPAPRVEPRPLPSEIDPLALADRTLLVDGQPRALVFRARASEVIAALTPPTRREDRGLAPRAALADAGEVDRLAALLRAEGATHQAVVGLGVCDAVEPAEAVDGTGASGQPPEDCVPAVPLAVVVRAEDGCRLHRLAGLEAHPGDIRGWQPGEETGVTAALTELGLGPLRWIDVTADERAERTAALRPLLDGARDIIIGLRERRLREVGGHFVDPDVAVVAPAKRIPAELNEEQSAAPVETRTMPARTALDAWLIPSFGAPAPPIALVLGEFGAGKSTLLADWCLHRWRQEGDGPQPILIDLAGAGEHADALSLVLGGCSLSDTPAHRAAVDLLISAGHAVPCFDGFDEMATRLHAAALAGRLAALTQVVAAGGHAVVSSRSHYFPDASAEQEVERALALTLAHSAPHTRLEVRPFDEAHVRRLVTDVVGPARAPELLGRIQATYDLRDLARRPLLLGMVLQTLDQLPADRRVTQAVLYEQYLARWLDNTHTREREVFTDAQKRAFAETLAEALWRTGATSLGWDALQDTVRERLFRELPDDAPPGAALLEIAGGAFFVRDGDDLYRFAHKSFLEYFFARAMVRGLAAGSIRGLDTHPLSPEVVAFVAEVLRLEAPDAPARHAAVVEVQRWITRGRADVSEPKATAAIAANATRLLHGLSRDGAMPGTMPDEADLRGVRLDGEDLGGIALRRARLDGASLRATRLVGAVLDEASLVGAALDEAVLDNASLAGAQASGASFVRVSARGANLRGANLCEADLGQSQWVDCEWAEARLPAVSAEGAVFVGAGAPASAAAELRVALRVGHQGGARSMAWSPDAARIASAGGDATVQLWDATTGVPLARLEGHRYRVTSVAWSPDGARIASAGDDDTMRLWDATTGAELVCIEGHPGRVTSMAWSPDGARLASASDDDSVRLWDATTGYPLALLEGHQSEVTSVAWSPDGTRLASASDDAAVRLWDATTGVSLALLEGHQGAVTSVAWSPDGTRLASASDDATVRLWDATTGYSLALLEGHQGAVTSVAWSRNGERLASAGDDATVRLWDATTGVPLGRLEGHSGRVTSVAWSRDGERLASAGDDATIRLWDATTGVSLALLEGHQGEVTSVAWSRDGTRLANADADNIIRLWDATTGAQLARLEGHPGRVTSVAWSPDGARLASAGGTVWLWDATTGALITRLKRTRGRVTSVAWSPDGAKIAGACTDATVCLWDAMTGTPLVRHEGHLRMVTSVAWSPNGARLATASSDATVRLWDVTTGAELARLEGHQGRVTSVAWSPDGARLASAGSTVWLWDATTGALIARLKRTRGRVTSVAWSPDGARLAGACTDATVCLWDTTMGVLLGRLEGHRGRVTSVAWSPDGARLASAGDDATVRLWGGVGDAGVPATELAAVVMVTGDLATATLVPSGYLRIDGPADALPVQLETRSPRTPGVVRLLPLGALRPFFDRPELVARSLAGALIPGTPLDDMRAAGWHPQVPAEVARVLRDAMPFDATSITAGARPPTLGAAIADISLRAASPSPGSGAAFAAHPTPRSDPPSFIPGPAITDGRALDGRAELLDELMRLTAARTATALLGPRRAGKTSLLYTLASRLRDTHDVHHVTLEGSELATRDDLARRLDPALAGHPAPAEALLHARHDRPAVYLIDELSWLTRLPPDHLAWLRALGQHAAMVVLAGSPQDWRRVAAHARNAPGSSFTNDVWVVDVGPLTSREAVQFLLATGAGRVSEPVARWIVEECGGWPFYLQVMGFAVEQEERVGRAVVTRDHVIDLRHRRLIVDRDPVFAGRWEELPPLARAPLLAHLDRLPPLDDLALDEVDAVLGAGLASAAGTWLDDQPWFQWIRLHARRLRRAEAA